MPDKSLVHPEQADLIAFGLGKLEPDEATKIETHLAACQTCCDTLLDLTDDTFVQLVRKSPEPTDGEVTNRAISGQTMLMTPDGASLPADLPAELRDHPRYEILELIGRGGMGDVYKAQHKVMNRAVALKLIKPDLVTSEAAVDRFHREVQTAARLHHGNIVTAHDAEQAGNLHFLVMEFVEGVDLDEFVRERNALPVSEACEYICQAAAGLQHAHEQGMVHRDIKPHNLMLTDAGEVKILDFGLANFASEITADVMHDSMEESAARSTSPLTQMGAMMGTPDYIAPEQAENAHSADIRADIYSLGCTLYTLLTGQAPFGEGSVLDKIKAHTQADVRPLSDFRDDVPEEVEAVLRKMMAKNPDERFQTPNEVAAVLSPFSEKNRPTLQGRKVGRRFAVASALLLPLVLAAGVFIYLAMDTGQVEIDATGINSSGAKVVLLKNGKDYATFNLKSDDKLQTIRAGEYEIQLQNAPDAKLEIWSKRRETNSWGEPADHENEPIVLYRGGGILVQVTRQQALVGSVTDQVRLQGKWVPVSGYLRTKPMSAEQLANLSVTFGGDRVTLTDPDGGGQIPSGTFSIDAERDPKHITMTAPEGSETLPGIFQIDGDRLKLAWNDEDYARPTDFEPAQTPDHMTTVFKRVPGSSTTVPRDGPVAAPVLDETQREVVKSAEAYLAVMDEGKFGPLWNMLSSWAQQRATRGQLSQTLQKLRDTFGKVERRTLSRVQLYDEFPGLPKGRYAGVQYKIDCARQKGLWESVLLNVDSDGKWRVNTYALTLESMPFPDAKPDPATSRKKQAALSATQEWLKLVDAGKYGESWETSSKINRDGVTKRKLVDVYDELFQPLGAIKTRVLLSNEHKTQMPNAPVGDYAVLQYRSRFTNGRVIETVVLTKESDGQWRVSGYFHAEDNSTPPPAIPNQNGPKRRTGILANPPSLPAGGLPVGKNLITDPSLEAALIGSLPEGWSAWLNDGPEFKCEVVEGGVSGKHCLHISGKGTRGVVFCTSIPMDRTKRYALKGRVKLEGEATSWAVIKINYFNKSGWLGMDDRVGVTSKQSGWQFFEKTDRADAFPEATLMVPTCHIEGSGTAWFDDLELVAYDRDRLPAGFDKTHGKNNRRCENQE